MKIKKAEVKNRNYNAYIIVLMVLMYIVVAMSDNFKGIFVPFFKEDFGVNNTQIGYIMMASLFSYAVFQFLGGIIIERIGYKKVISLGFILAIAALAILVTCNSYISLLIGLFILNSGTAMFNVGVNTLGTVLTVASTAVLMNFINFSYGAGNTIIQKIAGNLLANGIRWQRFYMFMLICCVALLAYLTFIKIPYSHKGKAAKTNNRELFKSRMLYFYILALGLYMATEYSIGNWFVNYMNESFHLNADKRSLFIALFFGTETIGRLFGGFIVDRLGYFRSILIYGCVASVLVTLGIALGESGLIVFSVSGLFFSIIYPTIMTTIRVVFKDTASYATGLILMCGTLIAMGVSMLIGLSNDLIGVYYSFYSIAVSLILCTVMLLIIKRTQDKIKT